MVVLLGLVDFDEIGRVIDLDVILFLIGMFSLVGLANSSGLLELVSLWFISIFRRRITLIYGSSILFGVLSAFAVNDTVALMGPPIAYTISKVAGIEPKFMFLLLAFSLTIGSVMTPIGNPQKSANSYRVRHWGTLHNIHNQVDDTDYTEHTTNHLRNVKDLQS
ncbi:MAG: hypothetical protein LZ158_03305 [Thaumarchaeota archaeon]|nr:hypothetical protein [Candidatus Terraquivivens yellowstonensis]MCL7400452.1 hypothetical protein [Candidatus Terraquivivens yellowstonensis]